ncbi:hypothetical protein J3R83DRAFT_12903 [Lanmaoa asiatica]|nr:hypothetical protein J3R83DRAFT_12903 [Lanmaoa asiatica]
MGHDTLPPYTPSTPSPRYSCGLLPGEQTVESTRRTSSRPPTGVYRRITDRLTVVLRDQHPGSVYPIYGRSGVIQGNVILSNSDTDDLTSVILKVNVNPYIFTVGFLMIFQLEGHFLLHASGVPVSTTFLSTTYVLWSASHTQHCPRTIPFGVIFPLTFDDGGQARALPPTFESSEPHVACSYSLTVELSCPRRFLSLFKGNEAVKIPLIYRPRSRPHLPMLPSDLLFMSTVKSSPEEWHEVMCTLPMSQGSGLAHVEGLLFIPSLRTYSLSDTIPFHLQIRGSPASLIPFLEHGQDGRQGAAGKQSGGVVIRVYLLRQFSVRIHGQFATASRNLGEGKMEPSQSSPSRHHTFLRHPLGEGLDSLDWDGVLRCDEDVTVPSFSTNQVSVMV